MSRKPRAMWVCSQNLNTQADYDYSLAPYNCGCCKNGKCRQIDKKCDAVKYITVDSAFSMLFGRRQ